MTDKFDIQASGSSLDPIIKAHMGIRSSPESQLILDVLAHQTKLLEAIAEVLGCQKPR